MTATPKRDSLTKSVRNLREHQQILGALDFIAQQKADTEKRRAKQKEKDERLIPADSPYRRPCGICVVRGYCEHREPLVESAYAEVVARRRVT